MNDPNQRVTLLRSRLGEALEQLHSLLCVSPQDLGPEERLRHRSDVFLCFGYLKGLIKGLGCLTDSVYFGPEGLILRTITDWFNFLAPEDFVAHLKTEPRSRIRYFDPDSYFRFLAEKWKHDSEVVELFD